MALTRAGKKRELETDGDGTQHAEKQLKTSKHVAKATKKGKTPAMSAVQKKKKKPKGFLEMPPELRNCIYDFACEDDFGGWENAAPLVVRHRCGAIHQWPMGNRKRSARKFFGLTQVCKQIRTEYRPLWLRNASVRLRFSHIQLYVDTFHGFGLPTENLHKLLQVSYDQEDEPVVQLAQLIRYRAHNPSFKAEFIPHELTLDEGPWNDFAPEDCEWCLEDYDLDSELGLPDECEHEELHRELHVQYLMDTEYTYLPCLNSLLSHDNSEWIDDIRTFQVNRVQLDTTPCMDQRVYTGALPDIFIFLADQSSTTTQKLSNKSMADAYRDYVESRGLIPVTWDLGCRVVIGP